MLLPNKLLERRYAVQVELWTIQRKIAELESQKQEMQNHVKELEYRINRSRGPSGKSSVPKSVHKEREALISSIAEGNHIIHKLREALNYRRKELGSIETEVRRIYGAVGSTVIAPSDVELFTKAVKRLDDSNIPRQFRFDTFISHASEDKAIVARPLYQYLTELGVKVWFDEMQLEIGNSLRRSIDTGLTQSRFGIVIISPHFLAKSWTQYELDSLVAREMESGKVILPIWHKVSKNEVLAYSPKLADKLALHTSAATLEEISLSIALVITKPQLDLDTYNT